MSVVSSWLEAALSGPWLPAVLLLMVTMDGPFPVVPSEPLLFASSALALGTGNLPLLAGLAAAAVAGSLLGDALLYTLGRASHRAVATRAGGLGDWTRRHLRHRPVAVLATLRLVPAGRLASVTAAGRAGVPARRVAVASIVSSVLWTTYMITVGLLLSRVTGGDPVWSLAAGLASGLTVGGLTALIARAHRAWRPTGRAASAGSAAAGATHHPRGGCPG